MALVLPEKCLRSMSDCEPLAQIESDCKTSFICCGKNDAGSRTLDRDVYRVCFHNETIDERTDWDKRDITDTLSVLAQALSIEENQAMAGQAS